MAKTKKAEKSAGGGPLVSLIIPARNHEPMLQQTINRAIESAGCEIELIVVDGGGLGPYTMPTRAAKAVAPAVPGTSASRHAGMMAATADVCVTIDAHVRLADNWALTVGNVMRSTLFLKAVACGHVGRLTPDFQPEGRPQYHGATLNWMDTSAEPRALVARWSDNKPCAEIGAIMGAYYAINRDWYAEIGQPWAVNRGWGCDEEVISLASWIMGGCCRTLPASCEAWHLFGHGGTSYSLDELMDVVRNRQRLLQLFPFTPAQRQAQAEFIRMPIPEDPGDDNDGLTAKLAACYRPHADTLQRYLETRVTGFPAWASTQTTTTTPPPPPVPTRLPLPAHPLRLATRPLDVCDQCDGRNTFVVTDTEPRIRRLRCTRCGRRAWRQREDTPLNFSTHN
jgi:glycosyltransferase involved in cell wall biosynthesis